VIGYTRDGTVPIIKDLRVTQPDDYVVGYKGYMTGDAAKGLMSMYDLFVNNAWYYAKGTCSNYHA
jgi:hypothetical protein